jgi:uncharacterized protein with NAD-binding domain and iron-sulfur cluster
MSTRRVAVLGGGIAGLTTAYELATASEDVEVVVYQMGWRLGGKVASSRNLNRSHRIEEHGIHVLFGAYENAFHLLRRAYGDLGQDWKDAFEERHEFTLMERVATEWVPWPLRLDRAAGDPGDCLMNTGACSKDPPELTRDLILWLGEVVLEHFRGTRLERPATWFFGKAFGAARQTADVVCEQSAAADRDRTRRKLLWRLRFNLFLLRVVAVFGWLLWQAARPFFGGWLERYSSVRRTWIAAELGIACAAGLTEAALEGAKRVQLDDQDLTAWLKQNKVFGARLSRWASEAAPLRMVYEVVFAYKGGDPDAPALAAGTAVRNLLRLMFDRRGSLAYVMRAGSAETMITPLYRALVATGRVRFEFFHRVDGLELTPDGRKVARVLGTVQARATSGKYEPLLEDGSWPDEPMLDQLEGGEQLRQWAGANLSRMFEDPSVDIPGAAKFELDASGAAASPDSFDRIVLAIPIEALRPICAPLAARSARWQRMFGELETTATQAAQLWLDQSAVELGWSRGGVQEPAMLGGYDQPFGNWLDLSVTLERERWEQPAPRSVAYLCGPLADKDMSGLGGRSELEYVREACEKWLCAAGPRLWPRLFDEGGAPSWDRLIAGSEANGQDRLHDQFFRANTLPSDRYTLTLPGTTAARIAPGDTDFENLIIAGDWTANGFDVGAVESTVMSGRLAARAILDRSAAEMPIYGEDIEGERSCSVEDRDGSQPCGADGGGGQ